VTRYETSLYMDGRAFDVVSLLNEPRDTTVRICFSRVADAGVGGT
jgi:hypothetical protein